MKSSDKNIKYSIITPQYNSFNLMNDFFESLLSQKFKNFEVIIVDDKSTDGSYEKLQDYIKTISLDVKLFQMDKNSGPAAARNLGIKKSEGEYITFVDCDDSVSSTLFEDLEHYIGKDSIDSIVFDFSKKYSSGKLSEEMTVIGKNESGFLTKGECVSLVKSHTVGKVYNRETMLRNELLYPENLRRCEDIAFTSFALVHHNKVYYLKKSLYYYHQHITSLSNSLSYDEKPSIIAFKMLQDKIGDKYPKEIMEKSINYLLYGPVLIMSKMGKSRREIIQYISDYKKEFPEWKSAEMIKNIGFAKKVFIFFIKIKCVICLKFIAKLHSRIIGQ